MTVGDLLEFLDGLPIDAEIDFEYSIYYEGSLFWHYEEERVPVEHFSYEHCSNRVVLKEY